MCSVEASTQKREPYIFWGSKRLFEFSEIPAEAVNILRACGFECEWRGRWVSGVPKLKEIVKAIAEAGSSTS